jgi:hypothetical protein
MYWRYSRLLPYSHKYTVSIYCIFQRLRRLLWYGVCVGGCDGVLDRRGRHGSVQASESEIAAADLEFRVQQQRRSSGFAVEQPAHGVRQQAAVGAAEGHHRYRKINRYYFRLANSLTHSFNVCYGDSDFVCVYVCMYVCGRGRVGCMYMDVGVGG